MANTRESEMIKSLKRQDTSLIELVSNSSKSLNLVAAIDFSNLSKDQAIQPYGNGRIVDIEIGEFGRVLAVIYANGLLVIFDTATKACLHATYVDLTSIDLFLSQKPSASYIRSRYCYTPKRRHNYKQERTFERLAARNERSKSLTSDESQLLRDHIYSQAVRIIISQDEKYVFIFDGSYMHAYSVKTGQSIAVIYFEYNDFAVDSSSCKAYTMRKDGVFTIDLLSGNILCCENPPQEEGLYLLPAAIKIDSIQRYLTVSYFEVDIAKMPFGGFYANEFYLCEQDIGQILGAKAVSSMSRLGYGLELLNINRKNLTPLLERAFKRTRIATWDLATMSNVLVTTDNLINRRMKGAADPRNTPVYSSLFDIHYFMETPGDEVIAHSSSGVVTGVLNCRTPSVNFQIETINDFLIILDNDKKSGNDVIIAISQHDFDSKVIFDTSCDVYTNMRVSDLHQAALVGCSDGSIRLIDLESISDCIVDTPHGSGVNLLTSLTNGGFIASAGFDGVIAIWRVL